MDTKNINWTITLFLISYQALVLLIMPFYFYYTPPSWIMVGISLLLFGATGISITGGYHRFFSHKAYKAGKLAQFIFFFLGTMAGQGSIIRWSHDHRIHHAHVDTDKDPYSINKGFWYAHILWMFEKQKPIEKRLVADLYESKLLTFQHKHYGWLFFLTNGMVAALMGWLLNDYIGAFFMGWWMRLMLLHHSTWFINSLAHTWGSKSYSNEFSAVDNYIISLLTFGEGYHNYHHFFSSDYRNGIRWYHFDPTKWMIWLMSKLHLAGKLKKVDTYKIKKQVIKKDKDLLLEWVEQINYVKTEILAKKIQETANTIINITAEIHALKNKYIAFKNQNAGKDAIKQARREMRELQKNLFEHWKNWRQLFKHVMGLKTINI